MTDELRALLDREQIKEVRCQFGWALDTRDWDLFASLFTTAVDVDLPAFGVPAGSMPRQALVELFQQPFRRTPEEMGTQQLYGNFIINLAADSATARSYLLGHHHVTGLAGGEDVELRAVYDDRLVRTAGGWKISGTALRVLSMAGNPAIFA